MLDSALRPARFVLAPVALLVLGACATTSPPEALDAPPPDAPGLAFMEGLDGDRAVCVSDVIVDEALRTARRTSRSGNVSPLGTSARAERDEWFARRVQANQWHDLMAAMRVNASSGAERQRWAQHVLANSIYTNPAVARSYLRMGSGWGVHASSPAQQREELLAGRADRLRLISQDAEGFRSLAEAHQQSLAALVASGGAASPEVDRGAERVATLVRRDPALEVVYQEEFVLEYNFGDACGPAPRAVSTADPQAG